MESCAKKIYWSWWIVLAVAILIAAYSARPYAGCWNDGSRLAMVQALVDHRTLAIDDSIFVVPPPLEPGRPSPYPRGFELLQKFGTKDKMFIGGHYYSDKSPFPSFPMAAVYQVWLWCGGPGATERPDWFCLLVTWCSSGLAFVITACCFLAIGRRIGVPSRANLLVTLAFMLGSVALPFTQQVNNHILLLAVAALLFLALLDGVANGWPLRRLVWIGGLAGLGYTIDLAAGPLLCLSVGGFLLWTMPARWRVGWVVLAALPLVLCHHVVNYQIGGTIGPANAVPAYFQWPGSAFSERNMTGGWHHASLGKAAVYSLDMLFGKRGFLGHNLLLLMPLACLVWLVQLKCRERPLFVAGFIWACATWMLYAATSNNMSGACCSVRWFVPLLVPGFLGVCLVLREWPEARFDAAVLGSAGMALGILMALRGPWLPPNMPLFWTFVGLGLVGWLIIHLRVWRQRNRLQARLDQLLPQSATRVAA